MPVLLTAGWWIADTLQPPSYSPIVTGALYLVGMACCADCSRDERIGRCRAHRSARRRAAAIGIASLPEPAHGTRRDHDICSGIGAITIAFWPALAARQESVVAAVGPRRTLAAIVVSIGLLLVDGHRDPQLKPARAG
jgi:hypothetical protein